MKDDRIRIAHIKVGELEAFADRVISAAEPGQFVPLSMQRARAHAHNPYADPDDIGLLAAIDRTRRWLGILGSFRCACGWVKTCIKHIGSQPGRSLPR